MSKFIDRINQLARKVPTWVVYLLLTLPVALLLFQLVSGGLGVDPAKRFEHETGELSLKLIVLGLAITPLRKFLKLNLFKFRRAVGVMSFVYVSVHLFAWVLIDMNLRWAQMYEDIWKRPYITIGMFAFVLMIPLAVTSNNLSLRKMGAATWRKLHKLVYPIAVLGGVHYIMVQKVWETEPMVYLAVILALLATRIKWAPKARTAPGV
ncbi:protein-methionine-sulfoxide reductase heme-binding subunit MsrQ [Octadecabacter ascidiaceicola]|uniref:Protein-methionine-sulfoxide reductase heme-binding subunit MsrQ n=1 Tax=Octadecabacter ascidiaceicola TaxID=1655543 RepID=A0A238KIC1_9RHOB|nr:protein-methionine-sulfoxide reductase heme-binding subunit MsrQ [Octadecabacter ascidiaceicola]SMX42374.1 Sulfoxide reductase heme-binding subunit YedZ [Octadecabacter ascidiaceicola]